MTKAPFTSHSERVGDLLGLIHSDVCGPISSTARGGYQYFITFIDYYSRYGYLYLMKHKNESFEKFTTFKNEVQNQLGKSINVTPLSRGSVDNPSTCGNQWVSGNPKPHHHVPFLGIHNLTKNRTKSPLYGKLYP